MQNKKVKITNSTGEYIYLRLSEIEVAAMLMRCDGLLIEVIG